MASCSQERTALHEANGLPNVKLLLAKGADIHAQDADVSELAQRHR